MKRQGGTALLEHPNDYGTGFKRRGGRNILLDELAAADGMELVSIPDPSREDARHEVQVARRNDPLMSILDIYDRAKNDALHYLAAERLRADTYHAQVKLEPIDLEGLAGSASGGHPTDRQIDALERVRGAWLAVRGPDNDAMVAAVVLRVVIGFSTLVRVDQTYRWRDKGRTSRKMLVEGLERLAKYYGV